MIIPFEQLRVLVLVIGTLSADEHFRVDDIRDNLVAPIQEAGHVVNVALCTDVPFTHVSHSFEEHVFAAATMFDRMNECFKRAARGKGYDFFVRTRPDLQVYAAINFVPFADAVQARMRNFPRNHSSALSRTSSFRFCELAQPGVPPAVDDQFAVIPRKHADAYFSVCGEDWHDYNEQTLADVLASKNVSVRETPFPVRLTLPSHNGGFIEERAALDRCAMSDYDSRALLVVELGVLLVGVAAVLLVSLRKRRPNVFKLFDVDDALRVRVRHVSVFFFLAAIHAVALLLFHGSQVEGRYEYSVSSVVMLTEACKLCIAIGLYSQGHAHSLTAVACMPRRVVLTTMLLAVLYTTNNYLSFAIVGLAGPGLLAIAKSSVPYLTAVVYLAVGSGAVSSVQWFAIFFQTVGVFLTQAHQQTTSGFLALTLCAISVLLTSACSVLNERIVKTSGQDLNAVNAVMYFTSLLLTTAPLCTYDRPDGSFFAHYNLATGALVFVMSVYGVAVAYAYKLANVFVKNLANSASVCAVWLLGLLFCYTTWSPEAAAGVVTIVAATMLYFGEPLQRIPKGVFN